MTGAPTILFTKSARCTICSLHPDVVKQVHGAMWDVPPDALRVVPGYRTGNYRFSAVAILGVHGVTLEEKSVTRHAEHVERSARIPTPTSRAHNGERPVFATDYESVTQRAAHLGMAAFEQIEQRVDSGEMEDRELVSVAKMGVIAVEGREKNKNSKRNGDLLAMAIMQLGGGFIQSLPEGEVIDGFAVEVLDSEMAEERAALLLQAGYAPSSDG